MALAVNDARHRFGRHRRARCDIPPDGTFVPNPDPKGYPAQVESPISAFGENRTVWSHYDFLSQEIQLKSRGKHVIDWIVGGYFSHERNAIRFDVDQRNGYRDGTTRGFVGSFIQPTARSTATLRSAKRPGT